MKQNATTPKSALKNMRREDVTAMYLIGRGIEIGALHNPLAMPQGASVSYVDRMSVAELRQQYPELGDKSLVEVDIIDNGETLEEIPDGMLEFVVANHFLEHCRNPIRAFSNMLRVLCAGGILYMAIPDKRYSFDVERPVTPIEHLVRDFEEGPEWSEWGHHFEWAALVNKVLDPEAGAHDTLRRNYSIHYHVWDQKAMLSLVFYLKEHYPFEAELIWRNENEVVFVLRKT